MERVPYSYFRQEMEEKTMTRVPQMAMFRASTPLALGHY